MAKYFFLKDYKSRSLAGIKEDVPGPNDWRLADKPEWGENLSMSL